MKAAALQQRCERAAAQLAELGLPATAVLNLSKKEAGAPVLLPALVLDQVDGPEVPIGQATGEGAGQGPFYVALTADNRLVRASVTHVVGLAPAAR
jgi:hypothetical protein